MSREANNERNRARYRPIRRMYRHKVTGRRVVTIGRQLYDVKDDSSLVLSEGSATCVSRWKDIWEAEGPSGGGYMRTEKRVYECVHCGAEKASRSETGFKCRQCGRYTAIHPNMKSEPFRPSKTGKLKGYCKECGMMLMDSDEECPRLGCFCTEVVAYPPAESRLRQRMRNTAREVCERLRFGH